ncbi:MAG: LysM peptidoglycan-binding domain-containing protein [Verrucomicrobiaceae bacterium]|nr:LysM peptidoglycan-binding domain-containing protein [Verrucomicrobiaceae bacterium]
MARAQFKLLLFLITVGLFAGVIATGWWVYENILLREQRVEKDLAAMKGKDRPKADPGARRFEAAVELIKGGGINDGRDALYRLLQQFPESATCPEARRIIGEINMDQLFSPAHMGGKKEYIVQPGDSLNLIAQKNQTNVDFIIRLNNMMSTTLQPGDRLTVAPIEFHLGVVVSKKQVLLNRKVGDKEYLFKQYNAREIRLPPGAKIPFAYEIGVKSALLDGKPVLSTDPRYLEAEKWIPASKPGIVFRTPPVARAVAVPDPAETAAKSKKSAAKSEPEPPAAEPAPETGIFLSREDLEELFALVRKGSKLELAR